MIRFGVSGVIGAVEEEAIRRGLRFHCAQAHSTPAITGSQEKRREIIAARTAVGNMLKNAEKKKTIARGGGGREGGVGDFRQIQIMV